MKKRFLMTAWGSFGDLHPYIAVAIGVRARGHDVAIAAGEVYRAKIEAEGIRFHPARPDLPSVDDTETVRRVMDPKTGSEFVIRKMALAQLEQSYEDLLPAARGYDLLVGHAVMYALPLVAETLRLPWVSVALQPIGFFSAYDPSVIPAAPKFHRLQRLVGRRGYAFILGLVTRRTRSWMRPVDDLRKRLGLSPARGNPLIEGAFSPLMTLAWFSPLIAPPQPDWPVNTRATGFPFYDRLEPGKGLDPRLAEFLKSGDPPIVFTLGTSAVFTAGDFYEESILAARKLGKRAVLLAGPNAQNPKWKSLDHSIFVADYAPHSELLPHAAATVHQGGIGTTAQALRAGRPMLVTPYGHDQPDNAERAARLGVARVVYPQHYTAERAVKELQLLLSDRSYSERAAKAGHQIRSEDGVAAACDALEEAAASR